MGSITHLTPVEAAVRMRRRPQTLANWRGKGWGPPWSKGPGTNGRILYALADVDAWLAANPQQSTAETPTPPAAPLAQVEDDIYGTDDGDIY